MTIADKIRIEKRNQLGDFDAVHFMEIIEDYFQKHEYYTYLRISRSTWHKTNPNSCDGMFHVDYSSRYPELDNVGLPAEYFEEAKRLLISEGFYLYSEAVERDVLVKIEDTKTEQIGIHTYYKIN